MSIGGLDDVIALFAKILGDCHTLKYIVLDDEDRGRTIVCFVEGITVDWIRVSHGWPPTSLANKTRVAGFGSGTTLCAAAELPTLGDQLVAMPEDEAAGFDWA